MTARERAKQDYGALSGRRFHKDEHVQEAETELNASELGMEVKRRGWISQRGTQQNNNQETQNRSSVEGWSV